MALDAKTGVIVYLIRYILAARAALWKTYPDDHNLLALPTCLDSILPGLVSGKTRKTRSRELRSARSVPVLLGGIASHPMRFWNLLFYFGGLASLTGGSWLVLPKAG